MSTQIFLKKSSLILILLLQLNFAIAQDIDGTIKNLLNGTGKIGLAYAKPATTAISSAMATGWSNSAKVLLPWQLEARLGGSMVWIPTSDQQFDIQKLDLPANFDTENTDYLYPTVFGSTVQNNSRLLINDNDGNQLTRFRMPPGLAISKAYIPQLQVGSGLPYKSAIYIRFTPSINIQDYGKGGFYGFALQKQLFHTKLKKQKELTTSVLLSYNNLHYNYTLIGPYKIVKDPNADKDAYNQRIKDQIHVWNFDALLSYHIPFQSKTINSCFKFTNRVYKPIETYIEPFVSIGYINSRNKFNAYGNYNLKVGYYNGNSIYEDFDGQTYAKNRRATLLQTVQGTAGFTLNVGFVRLFGSYTLGRYSLINAGLGFKFFAYKTKHNGLTDF